ALDPLSQGWRTSEASPNESRARRQTTRHSRARGNPGSHATIHLDPRFRGDDGGYALIRPRWRVPLRFEAAHGGKGFQRRRRQDVADAAPRDGFTAAQEPF